MTGFKEICIWLIKVSINCTAQTCMKMSGYKGQEYCSSPSQILICCHWYWSFQNTNLKYIGRSIIVSVFYVLESIPKGMNDMLVRASKTKAKLLGLLLIFPKFDNACIL